MLNGYVMSKNRKVVRIEDGLATWTDPKLAPLYFRYKKDIEGWFDSRLIDENRTNSRLLKKVLRLKQNDSVKAALFCHAATITDTYWFQQDDEDLDYSDVRFSHNFFDQLALRGDPNAFSLSPEPTPELTNTGSYEKCWRLEDGDWWMYKSGTHDELFSELFIGKYAEKLQFPVAEYVYYNERFIRTRDFTDNAVLCFEEITPVVDGDDNYEVCFKAIGELSEEYFGDKAILQKQYLQILYVDSVCYNMDRHSGNFGFLRDPDNGQIVSMAPNYDNNTALVARGFPNPNRHKDGIIQFLKEFVENNKEAHMLCQQLDIHPLDENEINDILKELPIKYQNEKDLVGFIYEGQEVVAELICPEEEQHHFFQEPDLTERIDIDPADRTAPGHRRDPAEEYDKLSREPELNARNIKPTEPSFE